MKTTDDFWRWAKTVIMQEMRAGKMYNDAQPFGLMGFLDDHANRIIGYPILRQIRIKRFVCHVEPPMSNYIKECTGGRGLSYEDTRNYCIHWMSNGSFPAACQYPEFMYEHSDQLSTFSTMGRLSTYSGGGYVMRLQGTVDKVLHRMDHLQKLSWVDKRTRAVFLEFSVYNANANLFSTCVIIFEFIEGGGITATYRFEPVRLTKTDEGYFYYVVLVSEVFFATGIVFFTLRELWKIKQQKLSYFYDYWNWAEIVLISMSYVEIFMYFYKKFLISEVLKEFKKTKGNAYLRIDSAALIDQYYGFLLGFIMFLCMIKLIKLLKFNKRMDVLALTIGLCWDELSYFIIAFIVIFFSFASLFYFIFFMSLPDFNSIVKAVMTSFAMMLGKFEFEEMKQASEISPLLFFVFSVSNGMVLINIMMSIILGAFKFVQEDLGKRENKYDLMDFIWSKTKKESKLQPNSVNQVLIDKGDKADAIKHDEEKDKEKLPDKVHHYLFHVSLVFTYGRVS